MKLTYEEKAIIVEALTKLAATADRYAEGENPDVAAEYRTQAQMIRTLKHRVINED